MLLLTWNVLADAYVRRSFYPRTPRELLAPGARTAAIVACLEASRADLVCLQEVEPALLHALVGWRACYARKPGKREGCALLAREPLDARTLALPDDQVAILGHGEPAGVATTHLRWDPPGTPRDRRQAIREAEALLAALPTGPWIVCGDLNVEPGDDVCALFAAAGFRDACAALGPTANPNGRAKRIDHVLLRGPLAVTPRPIYPVGDATPLPSAEMPSDHVPIAVEVVR
jgi:endonuclease/exonuclease/phosphatase family metal-dependent hydrolase